MADWQDTDRSVTDDPDFTGANQRTVQAGQWRNPTGPMVNVNQSQNNQAPSQAPDQGSQWSQENIMGLFNGGLTQDSLKAATPQLNQWGIHVQNEQRGDERPRILLPDGRTVDLGDWGGQAKWVDRGNMGDWNAAYNNGEGGGSSGGASGGSMGGSSGSGANFQDWLSQNGLGGNSLGGVWGDRSSGLWDLLMGHATQGLDVSAKDPVIAGQVNAYRANQVRGVRDQLGAAAEAGGPYNNMGGETRMAYEKANQNVGGLQAQLMQNELNSRRQEIMQSLGMMGGMASDQQRMALQRELGMINAAQNWMQTGLNAEDRANYWNALGTGLIG